MMMLKICQSFLCHTQQMCPQTFVDQQLYPSSVVLQLLCTCSSRKKNHTHPMEAHWKFLGEGVLKAKILEANYEAKLESFAGGGGGGC